jgi:hypothetical protein|tara:strand:+ start:8312 stop:8848 length:537 start_codon:yes stop_codon:yes gene_type:complete
MKLSSKSKKRLKLLDVIKEGITSHEIFETIDYKNQSEDKIKQFIYPNLLNSLSNWIVKSKGFEPGLARKSAKTMVKWEGNIKTTVKNIQFMGTSNRPDMTVETNGVRVAIEFKRGKSGSSLREGFGQSLIYSTAYDFVIYMFIDTSDEKKIVNGATSVAEQSFLKNIWDNFNIKFLVV